MVYAVIEVESRWDSRAVGRAGEQGLCQIRPVAAAEVLGRPVSRVELQEPVFNVWLGCRILRSRIVRAGDVQKALVMYNRGVSEARDIRQTRYSRRVIRAQEQYRWADLWRTQTM